MHSLDELVDITPATIITINRDFKCLQMSKQCHLALEMILFALSIPQASSQTKSVSKPQRHFKLNLSAFFPHITHFEHRRLGGAIDNGLIATRLQRHPSQQRTFGQNKTRRNDNRQIAYRQQGTNATFSICGNKLRSRLQQKRAQACLLRKKSKELTGTRIHRPQRNQLLDQHISDR